MKKDAGLPFATRELLPLLLGRLNVLLPLPHLRGEAHAGLLNHGGLRLRWEEISEEKCQSILR